MATVPGTALRTNWVATAAVPVPLTVTDWVEAALLSTLSVAVMVPVRGAPVVVGKNSMPRMQVAPGVNTELEVQLVLAPLRLKLADAASALRSSAVLPSLIRVTSMAGEDVPTLKLPKTALPLAAFTLRTTLLSESAM